MKLINSASEAVPHSEQQSIPSDGRIIREKKNTEKENTFKSKQKKKKKKKETGVRDTLSVYHHLYFMWQ